MVEDIVGILGAGGAGAVVGLIGSLAQKVLEYLDKKQSRQHEREMAKIRQKEAELEHQRAVALADKNIELAETEGEIKRDIAELSAFEASQKEVSVMYGGWVDKWRGSMRPAVTTYILILVSVLVFKAWPEDGLSAFSPKLAAELLTEFVRSLNFLLLMTVGWWFGSRASDWFRARKG